MAVPSSEGPPQSHGVPPGVAPGKQPGSQEPSPPPRVEEKTGFRHLLALRNFQLIWYAQVAAQLADKFLMFSLIILAYRLGHGSTPVAITLLAYTVPAVAIAPLAGVFADRHDRKTIMVVTNLVRALLVLLIPLASLVPAFHNDYVHLLVITFAFAAVGQLFSPAEAAAIPTVVSRETLITANSMVLATMVVTLVAGGVLAPIVSRVEIYAPYWIAAALFGAAGGLIGLARIPRPDLEAISPTEDRHPFHQMAVDLKEGAKELGSSPVLLLSFYELGLAVLVMFMMFTLAPAYVSQVLGIEAQDSYVILLPATVGALLSAGVLGQLGRKVSPPALLVGALAATGVTLVLLATAPLAMREFNELRVYTRWFGSAFSLLLGLEFGALLIPALTALMENTSDSVRGRIFALLFMVVNGVTAVPVLLTAVLSDWFGISRVIGALGVLLVGTGVILSRYAKRVFATAARPE
ncbi:MAG TPA: MFS transporter [Candidatus Dormibacteraeota bacterium]|jgi:MFS family permease